MHFEKELMSKGGNLKRYESIFVLDNNVDKDTIVESIVEKIKAIGAEVVKIDRWGKKRFAYEIQKRQYGDFTAVEFDAVPTLIADIEREYRLNEDVLRHLTYVVSKQQMKQRALNEKAATAAAAKVEAK